MTKQLTTDATINALFGTVAATVANKVDAAETHDDAVAAAVAALKGATLAATIGTYLRADRGAKIARAAMAGAVTHAAALVEKTGADMADVDAVRVALWPAYWTASGKAGSPTKGTTEESATAFNTLYVAAKRLAEKIVGKTADDVVVPKAAQALADQMVAFEAKVVAEALKRARAKAKKAAKKAA